MPPICSRTLINPIYKFSSCQDVNLISLIGITLTLRRPSRRLAGFARGDIGQRYLVQLGLVALQRGLENLLQLAVNGEGAGVVAGVEALD